jgi:cell division protein FtsZ
MGSGMASGEGRAKNAVTIALESPLLNDNDIIGAKHVLLNITMGHEEILMDEIMEITDYIQEAAGQNAEVIWGYAMDEDLEEDLCITVIATGFEAHEVKTGAAPVEKEKITYNLGDEPNEVTEPINRAVDSTPEKTSEELREPFVVNQSDLFGNTTEEISSERENLEDNIKIEGDEGDVEEELTGDPQDIEADSEETEKEDGFIIHNLDDAPLDKTPSDTFRKPLVDQKSKEAYAARQKQTKKILSDMKIKLRLPGRISDLENEPAYKRRNVILDEIQHSSESTASRFSVNEEVDENGERRIELRDDNPFLHDNVD